MKKKLPSGEKIAKGFRAGDDEITGLCYQWLMGYIGHFVGHLTSTPEDFVDLALEKFKKKCLKDSSFIPKAFPAVIKKMAREVILDDKRKQEKMMLIGDTACLFENKKLEAADNYDVLDQLKIIVNENLNQINPTCKEIIKRYYYKKESQKTIQVAMQFSTSNAVSKKMVRCRNQLKQLLVNDVRLKEMDSAFVKNLLNKKKQKPQ